VRLAAAVCCLLILIPINALDRIQLLAIHVWWIDSPHSQRSHDHALTLTLTSHIIFLHKSRRGDGFPIRQIVDAMDLSFVAAKNLGREASPPAPVLKHRAQTVYAYKSDM